MEKKRNLAPESSQLGEPPFKQRKSEEEQKRRVSVAMAEPVQDLLKLLKKEEIVTLLINASVTYPGLEQTIRELAMEKKRKESSQLGEPPLKQHKSEEEQENVPVQEEKEAFGPFRQTHPVFRQNNSPNYYPFSPKPVSGSSGFGHKNPYGDIPPSHPFLASLWEASEKRLRDDFGHKSNLPFVRALPVPQRSSPFLLISRPAFNEEDGGTFRQTAKLESRSAFPPAAFYYDRYESCFAIAGANYCVIAADFNRGQTKFSELSKKSVMASSGFQADVKALQEALSAENLGYEREHNKPMSCPEMRRLFCEFQKCHYKYVFIVLGGLDSEGKGCFFQHYGITPPVDHIGSCATVAPIHKYKLPPEDVLAQLPEAEAVKLAKAVFASATNTGDMLEIVVVNAKGVCRDQMDLMKLKASESTSV